MKGNGSVGFIWGGMVVVFLLLFVINVIPKLLVSNDSKAVAKPAVVTVTNVVKVAVTNITAGKVSTVVTEATLQPTLAYVERKIKEAKQKEKEGKAVKNFDPQKDGIIDLQK